MPPVILPGSFLAILRRLLPVFTAPSSVNFVVLVAGFVHALGGHRLTDALRAAGPAATKHYTTYYRFFSHARWSLDELGLLLIALIIELMEMAGGVVELVLDDTLANRTGKKVALAGMHADPLLKRKSHGRLFMSYGHVFVVLAVHIKVPALGETGWALPVMFRLFEGKSQGGRDDSPSDLRRRKKRRDQKKVTRTRQRMTDREVVDGQVRRCAHKPNDGPLPDTVRPKKTELGTELILLVAKRFPKVQFRVLADHLYNGRSVLHAVLSEVDNFQDCKQKLCVENPQTQLPTAVRRSVPFGMLLYSLVVFWYVTVGHREAAQFAPRLADPWYARDGRPSFSEMLAALRRIGWQERLLDPPSGVPPRQEVWADYQARVVAAA